MAGCADGRAIVTAEDGAVVGVVSPSDVSRAVQLASLAHPGAAERGTGPGRHLFPRRPGSGAGRTT
jgi:hypothetical protein